jgi:phosphatidylethanolamine-binding protein (PEBP) family uncharacterized protein
MFSQHPVRRLGPGRSTCLRNTGYDGPSPPPGHGTHRYFFRVFALDAEPELTPAASREELQATIEAHVRASGEHMGTYER